MGALISSTSLRTAPTSHQPTDRPITRIRTTRTCSFFPAGPRHPDLKLNSLYYELGENSFMKETVAARVMAEEGLVAPAAYHVEVHLTVQRAACVGEIHSTDIRPAGLSTHHAELSRHTIQPPHPTPITDAPNRQVYINGAFAGLYEVVEAVGSSMLEVRGA
jgi:hypothetical protein